MTIFTSDGVVVVRWASEVFLVEKCQVRSINQLRRRDSTVSSVVVVMTFEVGESSVASVDSYHIFNLDHQQLHLDPDYKQTALTVPSRTARLVPLLLIITHRLIHHVRVDVLLYRQAQG